MDMTVVAAILGILLVLVVFAWSGQEKKARERWIDSFLTEQVKVYAYRKLFAGACSSATLRHEDGTFSTFEIRRLSGADAAEGGVGMRLVHDGQLV